MSERLLKACGALVVFAAVWGLVAFGRSESRRGDQARLERARLADEERNGPCKDSATLLATTAGSPNYHVCPNRRHRMRIQIASAPSNEEFGAVAFCECQPDPAGKQP